MTSALVVYESMYGNTQQIALAVAEGLSTGMTVSVTEVGDAPDAVPPGTRLLVVGGPTHAFGMTRPSTRSDALQKARVPIVSRGRGIREWIETVSAGPAQGGFATFDTRVARPRVPGSAARKARKALANKDFRPVADAESFWVTGLDGPLQDGELERAREWGRGLAQEAAVEAGASPTKGV